MKAITLFVFTLYFLLCAAHAETASTETATITVDTRDPAVQKVGEVIPRTPANGGGVEISWASMTGKFYNLERSYDLQNWSVIVENKAATPPLNTFVDAANPLEGKVFYRLIILKSP